jgi:hypothetical protein
MLSFRLFLRAFYDFSSFEFRDYILRILSLYWSMHLIWSNFKPLSDQSEFLCDSLGLIALCCKLHSDSCWQYLFPFYLKNYQKRLHMICVFFALFTTDDLSNLISFEKCIQRVLVLKACFFAWRTLDYSLAFILDGKYQKHIEKFCYSNTFICSKFIKIELLYWFSEVMHTPTLRKLKGASVQIEDYGFPGFLLILKLTLTNPTEPKSS